MEFEFSLLLAEFKKIAEDYCDGRVDDLHFAVEKEINKLIKNDNNANTLYNFFGVKNKNKALLIKKAVKVVEAYCL